MNKPKPAKCIGLCSGCRDNFYNGNNPYGVKQCWRYPSAKVAKRMLIPIQMRPPYTFPPKWVLSCYKPNGYSNVEPKALDSEGFWKSW